MRALNLAMLRQHLSFVGRKPQMNNRALEHDEFFKTLCLERKRCERSNKNLLLMLIEGNGLLATDGIGSVRENVIAALASSTRETDVIGWYSRDSTLAVLFNDVGDSAESTARFLYTKIESSLHRKLSIEDARTVTISVHIFPDRPSEGDSCGPLSLMFYPDVTRRSGEKAVSEVLKRAIDIVGSVLLLIVLSPVFLFIAISIKLTSEGPVLFRQNRLGRFGRVFVFLKFRSMFVNCNPGIHKEFVTRLIAKGSEAIQQDANGPCVYKITHDPRVTTCGRWLRKSSLDELPQFINVLLGEMSLVGPRPALPYEVAQYSAWHRRRVLPVKPGITGLWQVNGRSRTSFDDMVRLDLQYIETASLALDLKILLQTPRAVLLGNGAY